MKTKKRVDLYKVLVDGCPIWGGAMEYSLPSETDPGDWHEVEGDLVQCRNGLHLTDDPSRRWRDGAECYLVETEGLVLHEPSWGDEYVARKVRLVRRLSWSELAKFGIRPDRDDEVLAPPKKKGAAQPPPPPKGPSPAMQFVRCAWENRCAATPHSWRTVNASMSDALMLAITAGMSFAEGDIEEINRAMNGGYWFGETGEQFYSAACKEGNLQAAKSFEAWARRKPFMWEGKRLYVGREFMWEGVGVTVTSFQDEKGALTACSYKPDTSGRGWGSRDIARRFSITNDQILRAEKDRKTTEKITQDAVILQKMLGRCEVAVDIETLIRWSPEEREAAGEWAKLAKHDAGKSRVKPPPAPSHLVDAIAHAEERARQKAIANMLSHIKDHEYDIDIATKRIQSARAELAKLRASEERAEREAA